MGGETIRVGEDTAADHEAICGRVLAPKLFSMGFVVDITVEDDFGFRGCLVAESENVGDEFVVSRDFGHFSAGAEMDGEGGEILP